MAYTFLNAVNASLKRAGVIQGDSGALNSFTDSARQHWVDNVVQIWNEMIRALYIEGAISGEVSEGSITLVDDSGGTRTEYSLPSDFEQFSGQDRHEKVLINASVPHKIVEYPGGYERMYADQPDPSDFTGRPNYWAINKNSGKLRLDTNPASTEAGEVYTFIYDKRLALTLISDTFPFSDTVVDELVPAVVEIFRQDKNERARTPIYSLASFNRALQIARQVKPRKRYGLAFHQRIDREVI